MHAELAKSKVLTRSSVIVKAKSYLFIGYSEKERERENNLRYHLEQYNTSMVPPFRLDSLNLKFSPAQSLTFLFYLGYRYSFQCLYARQ